MIVYEVIHINDTEDTIIPEIIHLGYFSQYEKAANLIRNRKELPGFRDYPNGFIIIPHHIDLDKASSLYVLWISVHDSDYEYDFERTIGIFKSHEDASIIKKSMLEMNKYHIMESKLNVELSIDEAKIDADNLWLLGFDKS